jgi:hypothetical protein
MRTFTWSCVIGGVLAGLLGSAGPAAAQDDDDPPGFDMMGMWRPLLHEDWFHRIPGATLGDYTGIPINEAARQKAQAWDASILSQPERQAQPHPAQYSFRGPGPALRIEPILDEWSELIGYATYGTFGRADRTIWLDGREHPSQRHGLHEWDGFSTGVWRDGVLVVTTTHMKYGVYQRNGTPASPYALMTEYWFRNGEYLTMVSHIEDPIYLEEPFVRSQTWVWNPPQQVGPAGTFEPVEEVDMGAGWVPHWSLGTTHPELANQVGIALEATQGGSVTLYPEYREQLRRMREEFDAGRAAGEND